MTLCVEVDDDAERTLQRQILIAHARAVRLVAEEAREAAKRGANAAGYCAASPANPAGDDEAAWDRILTSPARTHPRSQSCGAGMA